MKKSKLKIRQLEKKQSAVVAVSDEKLRLVVGGQTPTGGTTSDTADCDQ